MWTGRELVVWGGLSFDETRFAPQGDGAAYDPVSDTWRPLPAAPIPARIPAIAVWTGSEILVWGGGIGTDSEQYDGRGAAYDPTTDTWRELPASPLPAGFDTFGAWTGSKLLVLTKDTQDIANGETALSQLAEYDPARDAWRRLSTAPALCCYGPGTVLNDVLYQPGLAVSGSPAGAVYDIASDAWRAHAPSPEYEASMWPGFVEQLSLGDSIVVDNLLFRAGEDAWHPVTEPPLTPREFPAQLWTGTELIVWGGFGGPDGDWYLDGAAYDPAGDPRSTAPRPAAPVLPFPSDCVASWNAAANESTRATIAGWGMTHGVMRISQGHGDGLTGPVPLVACEALFRSAESTAKATGRWSDGTAAWSLSGRDSHAEPGSTAGEVELSEGAFPSPP